MNFALADSLLQPRSVVFSLQASNHLVTMQNQFSHHAIDYGYQINTIQCHKGQEILHSVSSTAVWTVEPSMQWTLWDQLFLLIIES